MPLPSFRQRRRIAITLTLIALVVMFGIVWIQTGRLADVAILTGGTLLCCVLLLALFGMRRRIPILPLGSVSTWTQVHIYMGFFTAGVYWMHVPNLIGNGIFECTLSIIFLLVTGSGFYGLYASRTLPKRLTAVEGQHRFDRVEWHRGQIADHAKKLLGGTECSCRDSRAWQLLHAAPQPIFQLASLRWPMSWCPLAGEDEGCSAT